MTLPQDVGSTVEACLGQTWEFLTGNPMEFQTVEDGFALPEPLLHFLIRLSPAAAPWGAGALLSLDAHSLDDPDMVAAEICNVCSGCVRRIFANRHDLEVGLPVRLEPDQVCRLLASARIKRCYASSERNVRFLAFECDTPSATTESAT
ncbi:MAG TPA: hypothetical protein VFF03_08610 [Rhodocyclaceae bacterium]|nr:hypothetical protein [Rhodocyclaceae bacterium]